MGEGTGGGERERMLDLACESVAEGMLVSDREISGLFAEVGRIGGGERWAARGKRRSKMNAACVELRERVVDAMESRGRCGGGGGEVEAKLVALLDQLSAAVSRKLQERNGMMPIAKPTRTELRQLVRFDTRRAIEEFFIHMLLPVSVVWVWWREGWIGMLRRDLVPGRRFGDKLPSKMMAPTAYMFGCIFWIIIALLTQMTPAQRTPIFTPAILTLFGVAGRNVSIAIKYGLRGEFLKRLYRYLIVPESLARGEELLYGLLPQNPSYFLLDLLETSHRLQLKNPLLPVVVKSQHNEEGYEWENAIIDSARTEEQTTQEDGGDADGGDGAGVGAGKKGLTRRVSSWWRDSDGVDRGAGGGGGGAEEGGGERDKDGTSSDPLALSKPFFAWLRVGQNPLQYLGTFESNNKSTDATPPIHAGTYASLPIAVLALQMHLLDSFEAAKLVKGHPVLLSSRGVVAARLFTGVTTIVLPILGNLIEGIPPFGDSNNPMVLTVLILSLVINFALWANFFGPTFLSAVLIMARIYWSLQRLVLAVAKPVTATADLCSDWIPLHHTDHVHVRKKPPLSSAVGASDDGRGAIGGAIPEEPKGSDEDDEDKDSYAALVEEEVVANDWLDDLMKPVARRSNPFHLDLRFDANVSGTEMLLMWIVGRGERLVPRVAWMFVAMLFYLIALAAAVLRGTVDPSFHIPLSGLLPASALAIIAFVSLLIMLSLAARFNELVTHLASVVREQELQVISDLRSEKAESEQWSSFPPPPSSIRRHTRGWPDTKEGIRALADLLGSTESDVYTSFKIKIFSVPVTRALVRVVLSAAVTAVTIILQQTVQGFVTAPTIVDTVLSS